MSRSRDAWPLACSVCDSDLAERDRSLVCPNGHSFDIAREGYVHLLPPQHRRRGIEGDTPEMLRARRRFLEGGYHAPLLERLTARVKRALGAGPVEPVTRSSGTTPDGTATGDANETEADRDRRDRTCVLEAGCGEGYYIGGIAERVEAGRRHAGRVAFVGTDLSKTAARFTARRHRGVCAIVADTHQRLYVRDASVDVLLNVFAPRNGPEFARVVRPGGTLFVIIPAPDHLASLRSELRLLDIQEAKEPQLRERMEPPFTLAEREEVRYTLGLPAQAVADLVAMGPSAWHREEADEVPNVPRRTEAAFVLLTFRRSG